uniref:Peptidase S1 domain-containing protein n=1 Tax=Anopheles coluzzii TaxID=1518534 RepID=A0A8W7PXB9_ANOCL
MRTYEMMEGTASGAQFVGGLKYLRNQVMSNEDCQRDILPAYTITAQHISCVNHNSVEYAFAILGSLFNGNTEWEQHINISMNGVRIHPPSPMYGHNDIATIHMDHPATLNEYVQPIRLPRLSDTRTYEMMEGTATSALNGEGLRYLRNQVMSNADCHEAIQPLYNISAQHICTDTYIEV